MQSLVDWKKLFYLDECGFISRNILGVFPSKLLFVQGSPVDSRSWRITGLELDLWSLNMDVKSS